MRWERSIASTGGKNWSKALGEERALIYFVESITHDYGRLLLVLPPQLHIMKRRLTSHDFLRRNLAVTERKRCAQIAQEQAAFWPRKTSFSLMGAMSALHHRCLDATSRYYPISARLLFHLNSINAMGLGVYVQQEKKQILDDI